MSSDQMPAPGKIKLIKFPPPGQEKTSNARGMPGRGDVEASIWLILNANKHTLIRPWRNEEQKVDKLRKRHYTRMAVLQSLINRLGKKRGKREKKNYYNTGYSYLVTQPSTNHAQQGLTLLSGCSMLLSLWYSNSTLSAFLKFLRWEKVSKREKNSDTAWLGK